MLSSVQAFIEWRLDEKSNSSRGNAWEFRGKRFQLRWLLRIAGDHPQAWYHVETQNGSRFAKILRKKECLFFVYYAREDRPKIK
jgi:hypothetical protein